MDANGIFGNVLKHRMLSLIAEFSPVGKSGTYLQQAGVAEGRIDFEAWRDSNLVAKITLYGDGIEFVCHQGIHGRLYPEFALDQESMARTPTGEFVDVAAALRTLRVSFRTADDVRLISDNEALEEETFVVDPDTEMDLIEQHYT